MHPVGSGPESLMRRLTADPQRLPDILPGRTVRFSCGDDRCACEPVSRFSHREGSGGTRQVRRGAGHGRPTLDDTGDRCRYCRLDPDVRSLGPHHVTIVPPRVAWSGTF